MKVHNECILPVITYGSETQFNTAAENGYNTLQDGTNNDGTNIAQQKKCKLA